MLLVDRRTFGALIGFGAVFRWAKNSSWILEEMKRSEGRAVAGPLLGDPCFQSKQIQQKGLVVSQNEEVPQLTEERPSYKRRRPSEDPSWFLTEDPS